MNYSKLQYEFINDFWHHMRTFPNPTTEKEWKAMIDDATRLIDKYKDIPYMVGECLVAYQKEIEKRQKDGRC